MAKRWNTTEINRIISGGESGDMISTVARTIGRTEDAVIVRAYSLGIGHEVKDGSRVLKSGINHYELTGNYAGRGDGAVTPVEDVVAGIVENLDKINDEDRYMYDLITGLTRAAMVMVGSKKPTPYLEQLLDAEIKVEEVVVYQDRVVDKLVYIEKPPPAPIDVSGDQVICNIFKEGDASRLHDLKKALGGRSKFTHNGNNFHLLKTERKITTGYLYSLVNLDTGHTLGEQSVAVAPNGAISTISAVKLA